MTQPMNRNARIPAIGSVAEEEGEFWVENPFSMPQIGENLSAYEKNRMYLNHDGTSFVEVSTLSAAAIDSDSRGIMTGDFNRDGKPDLLVSSIGGGPLRLFLNRFSDDNDWITLDLEGTKSNALGIGARVVIEAGGRKIYRDMFPQNGYMGMQATELVIGLGQVDRIDSMEIRWPSGEVTNLTNLPVNRRITVNEGSSDPVIDDYADAQPAESPDCP